MEPSILKLVILRGPRSGETLEFRLGSTVRMGRVVRGNDVAIKDPGVSSKHLTIEFDSGKWLIQDLDSSNGTGVNSKPIPPFTRFELHDNDTIELGECSSMLVRVVEEVAPEGRRGRRRGKKTVGAAEKENGGGVGEVEESNVRVTRSRKNLGAGLGLGLGLETAEVGVGKRTRRNVRGLPPSPAKKVEKEIMEEERREEESGGKISEEVVRLGVETAEVGFGKRTRRNVRWLPPRPPKEVEKELVEERREEESGREVSEEVEEKREEEYVMVKEERVEFEVEEEGKGEEGCVGLDWEKATLGEWFDHMEEHLRKQIVESSETMIDEMRMKAEKVCEYLTGKGQGRGVV